MKQHVMEWQRALAGMGLLTPSDVDGIFGARTERASFAAVTTTLNAEEDTPSNGGFKLGPSSRSELVGVHQRLVEVVERAIEITEQDFTVFDGIRTAAEQNEHYRRGASQRDGYNKKSMHQKQADGYGHAVDLVPWIDGKPVWDWDAIYIIADAVVRAAREQNVRLRWGGCWQVVNELSGSPENWVAEYVKRKQSQGQRAFNDGPHWELA